jgi:hypothetical protein
VNDTINITVTPVNDAPIVDNEVVTTTEDTPTTGDLTDAGDSDPDGTPLTANTTPVSGPSNGTIVINSNGSYTYTPNPNFNGTDTIVVSICDAGLPLPGVCVNDTIVVTVTPVNDAPNANSDNVFVQVNTSTPLVVLSNDTDAEGLNSGSVTIVTPPTNGTTIVDPVTGAITYSPNVGFIGSDTLIYQVCDNGSPVLCDTAIVIITVDVNYAPLANADSPATNEDTPIVINVLSNDTDPNNNIDPTSVVVVNTPSNGTVSVDPITGAITYTPNTNYSGTDTLIYQVCDNGTPALCDTAMVVITVSPVNDAPIVDDEVVTTPEDTPATGDLTDIGDTDPDGTPLTANTTPVSGPSNGTIVINSNGSYTYTPNHNFSGTYTVVVTICDGGLPLP